MRPRNDRKINKAILCCDCEDASIGRAKSGSEDAAAAVGGRSRGVLQSEYLHGALQRLPHAPGQGNADEGPEQRGFGVESTEPDAIGTRRTRLACARRCSLQ